jgi:A/G-specific adenine glycosylase
MMVPSFSSRVVAWQHQKGRHDLPWQHSKDPYCIWLSEVMLQQTQVSTVLNYYDKFLMRFPTVESLAVASEDEVLAAWSGLGYYRRARFLHQAAKIISQQGNLPSTAHDWQQLPGIGRSTGAAIAAFCYGERKSILDGNVQRLVARFLGWKEPRTAVRWWQQVESMLPEESQDMAPYTQGLMDLGAMVCTPKSPRCVVCPLQQDCVTAITEAWREIPPPKPRVKVEAMALYMWCGLRQGAEGMEVWLSQRPPEGIWGGLWCLPCFDDKEALHQAIFGLEQHPHWRVVHRLTHRILSLSVWLSKESNLSTTKYSAGKWYSLEKALKLGLPKPIRKILETLHPLSGAWSHELS